MASDVHSTLNASYVSSLSWYFICMFGFRGIMTMFTDSSAVMDETRMMQMQMGMVGGGQGFDAAKAFEQEAESLRLAEREHMLEDAEASLVKQFRAQAPTR